MVDWIGFPGSLARRTIVGVLCAVAVAGCGGGGTVDLRTEELWVVDFDTYGDEVAFTLLELDLDYERFLDATMDRLRELYVSRFYPGEFAITFVRGTAEPSATQSAICVRAGPGGNVGRAKLDIGNQSPDFNCGPGGGGELGAFIDTLSVIFEAQPESRGLTREQRTDAFAGLMALVLAHEIGHSLGLEHTSGIMADFPDFEIGVLHQFTREQERILHDNIVR